MEKRERVKRECVQDTEIAGYVYKLIFRYVRGMSTRLIIREDFDGRFSVGLVSLKDAALLAVFV